VKHPAFWLLVAVSVGVWLDELGRYLSQHAPVRHRPGFAIIEGRLHP
jgi:hypothetical protein